MALWLPNVPVMTAIGVLSVVRAAAVAEKVPVLCPEWIAMLAGTLRPVLLLWSRIAV